MQSMAWARTEELQVMLCEQLHTPQLTLAAQLQNTTPSSQDEKDIQSSLPPLRSERENIAVGGCDASVEGAARLLAWPC